MWLSDLVGRLRAHDRVVASRPHRRNQRLDAHDVHHARDVVGKYVQRHLGGDLRQTLHQEVGGAMNYPIFSICFALFASIAALVSGGTAITSMERNVSAMNIRPS